jgi:hypothetical protein
VTPLDLIAYLKVGWNAVSGVWKFAHRNKRNLTPKDRLAARLEWKPRFEDYLREQKSQKLRQDIIIRDMRRMDSYPGHLDGKRGISPWFRAGLIDTYDKGIMVGLGWDGLVRDGNGWRYADTENGERSEVTWMRTGYIPYENIESVDWSGDDYYGYPHVYCYFDIIKGGPYERVAFCERRDNEGWEFYTEITDYNSVRRLSRKRGISR